jgi:uncharacterized membrane protein YkoI
MPMTRLLLTLLACLAVAAGALAPELAQASGRNRDDSGGHGRDARGNDRARGQDDDREGSERRLSLDEAVAQAERRYNARAVRAEEKRHGDRIEYRIRLLGEDGRVFEVRIDAASGRED